MWEQIRANQIRSTLVVFFMGVLLVLLGAAIGSYFVDSAELGIGFALLLWFILNLVALFQGDDIMLSLGHAKKVTKQEFPRLFNVVEEMSIASGLPAVPAVYVVDDPTPNAFATGRKPEKAAVAVTSGLLQKLNRDELQGVIAHELGHVKNRDTLLMTIGGIMLGTIVILSNYTSRILLYGGAPRSRRDSSSGGGAAQLILIVVGVGLLILAPIAARLLYFALSRKREYLADASSALYTRYPAGLASALEKIASSTTQLKAANKATAPMYIVNPFRKAGSALADLTSTHPRTSERIRILRAMGGASTVDYESAYKEVHGGRGGVVPHSALVAAGASTIRAGDVSQQPLGEGEVERAREVSDVLWKKQDYRTIDCDCGARLRIPPALKAGTVRCPRCGTTHTL